MVTLITEKQYMHFSVLILCIELILFCLCAESPSVPVTGKTGESVTLTCESEAGEISRIVLTRLSKNILVCENEECKSENDRVFKEGSCDVFIKDLIFSDAGKYILRVRYTNDQSEPQTLEYHLHIHGQVKTDQTIIMCCHDFLIMLTV